MPPSAPKPSRRPAPSRRRGERSGGRPQRAREAPQRGPAAQRDRGRGETAGAEHLYGISPVAGALEAQRRRRHALYVRPGRPGGRLGALRERAEAAGLAVHEEAPEALEARAGTPNHQGVVLACGGLPLGDAAALLERAPAETDLVVALDEVEDPRNFGAVVRACAAFGARAAVVPRHRRSPCSPAASKASGGTLERYPVLEAPNLARFLAAAKEAGWWVAGTGEHGETPLPAYRPDRPLVVVLGNEGRGLRELVARTCDLTLSIPAPGAVSLNVSAAAAVLLYALTRR